MYALYGRQSRDKKDSISIESQFNFCMNEVPEGEKVKKYKDKGYSGKDTERPSFQRLLDDIKKGRVEKVIVYRLDRISRSLLDFAKLIEMFNEYNVGFVSATEKFDTSTPIGKAMLYIIMIFAELERETIRQRITDNYYERGKKGMFLGGNIPFAFELAPTKIDGNKTSMLSPTFEMSHVIDLFNRYAYENVSLGSLSRSLNEDEIKTSLGSYWDSAKISRLLKNPAYVEADADIYSYFKNMGCLMENDISEYIGENGLYVFGNKVSTSTKFQNLEGYHVVIAPHKGMVNSKEWLKCQYKLSKNRQIKNTGTSKYSWLSGLVKCGNCEYSMNINRASLSKKNNTYTVYLRCSGRTLRKVCDCESVRVEEIESIVGEEIIEYIKTMDGNMEVSNSSDDKRINELKIDISSKESEIENLIDNLASAKGVTTKYINSRIEKLDKEIMELNKEMNEINHGDDMDADVVVELKKIIPLWNELELEDKKSIARKLIDKVFLYKNGDKIDKEIVWKY